MKGGVEESCTLDGDGFRVDYPPMHPKNPFPGMNPWMQQVWSDCHTKLMGFVCESLGTSLPGDLTALAEEHVSLSSPLEEDQSRQADVGVVEMEAWKYGERPSWIPETDGTAMDRLVEPVIVLVDAVSPRWVEIRSSKGRLITVIEVTSPSNKTSTGRLSFEKKMEVLLQGGVNVMEIDLIRGGISKCESPDGKWPESDYQIVVRRPQRRDQYQVYPCPMREVLPAVRVPLREGDPEVVLDLQPLIDRCYAIGRYWLLLRYDVELVPPLSDEDRNWANALLEKIGPTE